MHNTSSIHTRPLTPRMVEILMDCHERELMNAEPCNAGTLVNWAGLITRGMLRSQTYTSPPGKKYIALYVTPRGKKYLNDLTNGCGSIR